jgi:hypothetical protein
MNDASRSQGWAICIGAGVLALLFLIGILNGSYLALAIPVATLTLFVLGLMAWVGYTIATIQVEAEPVPETETETEDDVTPAVTPPAEATSNPN